MKFTNACVLTKGLNQVRVITGDIEESVVAGKFDQMSAYPVLHPIEILKPELSDFYLDLHQSLAEQGFAKSLDRSTGMPTFFANRPPSRSWHISSEKIGQFR